MENPNLTDDTNVALADELARANRRIIAYAALAGFARGTLKALNYYELPKEAAAAVGSALQDVNDQLEALEEMLHD
jgi:hypothetical protein